MGAAAYAVTRTGLRRTLAAVLAVLALVASVGLIVAGGVTAKHALGRDVRSLKSRPTPGEPVGPADRPVLLMNPKSGGGKVERFNLVEEARRRGIDPVVLAPGDDLRQLAEQAVAGALDAFGQAVERRIDLGMAGERVFVNNATAGLYAKIVQSPAYRDNKVGTALELLPTMLGPDATPLDLRFTGPDGTEHASAHLILVSNDPYEPGSGEGFGSRRRIDAGNLGIVAASFRLHSGQPVEIGIDGQALSSTRRSSSAPFPAPSGSASPSAPPATPRRGLPDPRLGHRHRPAPDRRRPPTGPRRLSRRRRYQEARMRAWPPEPSS